MGQIWASTSNSANPKKGKSKPNKISFLSEANYSDKRPNEKMSFFGSSGNGLKPKYINEFDVVEICRKNNHQFQEKKKDILKKMEVGYQNVGQNGFIEFSRKY